MSEINGSADSIYAELRHVPGQADKAQVTGICRFYLMETRPSFRLYVTPIQIDPRQLPQQPPGALPGGVDPTLPPMPVREDMMTLATRSLRAAQTPNGMPMMMLRMVAPVTR